MPIRLKEKVLTVNERVLKPVHQRPWVFFLHVEFLDAVLGRIAIFCENDDNKNRTRGSFNKVSEKRRRKGRRK